MAEKFLPFDYTKPDENQNRRRRELDGSMLHQTQQQQQQQAFDEKCETNGDGKVQETMNACMHAVSKKEMLNGNSL